MLIVTGIVWKKWILAFNSEKVAIRLQVFRLSFSFTILIQRVSSTTQLSVKGASVRP